MANRLNVRKLVNPSFNVSNAELALASIILNPKQKLGEWEPISLPSSPKAKKDELISSHHVNNSMFSMKYQFNQFRWEKYPMILELYGQSLIVSIHLKVSSPLANSWH